MATISHRRNAQDQPRCKITVPTSRKHQPPLAHEEDLEDIYDRFLEKSIDQEPPHAEIAIIGGEFSKASPIHDRWLVSRETGLRFGSSLNFLGIQKTLKFQS